jgi:hypothetical protein
MVLCDYSGIYLLVKIGTKIVCHGRSISFQMAEVLVPRPLFQPILTAIAVLRFHRCETPGPSGRMPSGWADWRFIRGIPVDTRGLLPIKNISTRTTILFSVGLSLLVCIPVLLTEWPPLVDYVGNLARVHIIHDLLTTGRFAERYAMQWQIVPNLGIDAMVLPMLFVGIDTPTAGRLFVTIVIVATCLAVLATHGALFRRRSFVPMAAFAFAYNELLMTGFLNYQLAVAAALTSFAAWVHWRPQIGFAAATALLTIGTIVLFFIHLMGAPLLLGLIASYEVSVALLAWVTGQPARGGNRPRLLVLVVPALVMALLFAMSPLASPDAATPGLLNELLHVKRWRLALLPDVVLGYDSRVDVPTAMLFAAWVVAALATARVRIAVLMLPGIAGLLLLYLVVPEGWNTTWYIPQRLPVVIFLLCIASFDVEVRSRRELIASYIAMLLVVCARTGSAAAAWHEIDQERRPFVAVLSRLSPDSTIVDSHQAAGDFRSWA